MPSRGALPPRAGRLGLLALLRDSSTLAAAQNTDGDDDDDGTHIEGSSSSSFAMVGAVIGGILLPVLIALIALVGYGVGRWASRRRDKQARLAAPIPREQADVSVGPVSAPKTHNNNTLPSAASPSHSGQPSRRHPSKHKRKRRLLPVTPRASRIRYSRQYTASAGADRHLSFGKPLSLERHGGGTKMKIPLSWCVLPFLLASYRN
ncbi:hypothetical protein HMN09_00853700 [Mycena chlorophos]|uniref:Uncharacterized protein n=1 Tax=Mycena chlorophos TaxID=658473 RepID=A0A8H6STM5_MYCCL|nr:hypothetical protein HMN09_00853700 [Mycena chlorophos]